MADLFVVAKEFIAVLGSIQTNAALREHVALLKSHLQLIEKRFKALEEKNAKSEKRCNEMEKELARYKAAEQFEEKRGALFKRLPGGGYSETPYCPICHKSTWSFEEMFPYECSDESCGHRADFTKGEIKAVIDSLAESN
jgi:hypothetical protein